MNLEITPEVLISQLGYSNNEDASEILKEFHEAVSHFSEKYHVNLKKIDDKEVYYIIGKN